MCSLRAHKGNGRKADRGCDVHTARQNDERRYYRNDLTSNALAHRDVLGMSDCLKSDHNVDFRLSLYDLSSLQQWVQRTMHEYLIDLYVKIRSEIRSLENFVRLTHAARKTSLCWIINMRTGPILKTNIFDRKMWLQKMTLSDFSETAKARKLIV